MVGENRVTYWNHPPHHHHDHHSAIQRRLEKKEKQIMIAINSDPQEF